MNNNENSKNQNSQQNKIDLEQDGNLGKPTSFACPRCGAILWEWGEEELRHFCCRLGHIYSPKSLMLEQMTALKIAFRHELRVLKEKQLRLTR